MGKFLKRLRNVRYWFANNSSSSDPLGFFEKIKQRLRPCACYLHIVGGNHVMGKDITFHHLMRAQSFYVHSSIVCIEWQ